MFDLVLFEPEIPPNAGNVVRLCANMGATLHLVEPLGFRLTDRALRRAGLDYHDLARVLVHRGWGDCEQSLAGGARYALTTRGTVCYSDAHFAAGDALVFGPESRGLPDDVLAGFPADARLRLPMVPASRSLNLANAVAIVAYEAWRQIGFPGSG